MENEEEKKKPELTPTDRLAKITELAEEYLGLGNKGTYFIRKNIVERILLLGDMKAIEKMRHTQKMMDMLGIK